MKIEPKTFVAYFLVLFVILGIGYNTNAQNPKKTFKQAEKYFEKNNYDLAAQTYSIVIKLDASVYEAFEKRAQCYEKLNKTELAAKDYKLLTGIDPDEEIYFYKTGVNLSKLDRYEESNRYVNKALELEKKYIEALDLKTYNLLQLRKYREAHETANFAIKLESRADLYYKKGIALYYLENYEDAELCFRKVLSKENKNYKAMVWLGRTLTKNEKLPLALSQFIEAIKVNAKYPEIYKYRAETYEQMMKIDDAINDLSKYLMLIPNNIEIRYKRAELYKEFNQFTNAITDYNEIMNLDDKEYKALFYRGTCFTKLQDKENALNDFNLFNTQFSDIAEAKDLIVLANKEIYSLNKEENPPIVKFIDPQLQKGILKTHKKKLTLTISITDENNLNTITFNGINIEENLNKPTIQVSRSLNANECTFIEIEATDVYANIKKLKVPVFYLAEEYYSQNSSNNDALNSDVDKNIPGNKKKSPYRFALIIGNEDYSKYQRDLPESSNFIYARNDALAFQKYAVNTLGVPEKNTILLLDATAGQMKENIERFALLMQKTAGKGEFIFYYAGHGLPEETTKEPYLMPVDISGNSVKNGIPLKWVYQQFNQHPTQRVVAFIDACFSGGGREQGLITARAIKTAPKIPDLSGNMVVFTSCSKNQVSLPYAEKKHGMFTYHLLKCIQNANGDIQLWDLAKKTKEKVDIESLVINNIEQTPYVGVSPTIKDTWKNWKLVP